MPPSLLDIYSCIINYLDIHWLKTTVITYSFSQFLLVRNLDSAAQRGGMSLLYHA